MRLKLGLREGFSIIRTLLRLSNKSFASIIISGIRNLRQTSELRGVLRFLFGKRESYFGVIINYKRRVKHAIYLLVNDGRVIEVGTLKLDNKRQTKALEELYGKLDELGEVSRVMSYNKGGRLLFHPS
ncbi:hypothetical protein GF352_04405 [archaeon]|nr:hypothetical protein [archaeon]